MVLSIDNLPGWVQDEDGMWHRETVHSMKRRCRNWDYFGIATYMITLELNDRASRAFGEVMGPPAEMSLSPFGAAILEHVKRIPEFTPEMEVLGVQMMPDHLHMVLRVKRRMAKKLGSHLAGFKGGCTNIAREFGVMGSLDGVCPSGNARVMRGNGLFADGFVDTILFDEEAVRKALDYLADNPRRLLEKRLHPELFRVLRDLKVSLKIAGKTGVGHFAAIGNHHLLTMPNLVQVQCSRRDFAYRSTASGELLKNDRPAICTSAFTEKANELLASAAHGAVLVSPCISHGEKEIAARAFKAGFKVITLQNKGFSDLYKPGGKLFDTCAAGNLLMLAPAAWPYLPGKKPITRVAACTLNYLAQLIAGSGAAQINYRGMTPNDIESAAATSVNWASSKGGGALWSGKQDEAVYRLYGLSDEEI